MLYFHPPLPLSCAHREDAAAAGTRKDATHARRAVLVMGAIVITTCQAVAARAKSMLGPHVPPTVSASDLLAR